MKHNSKDNERIPVVSMGITFAEIPDRMAVYIELGDCCLHCKGCHSPELCTPMTQGAELVDILEYVQSALDNGANAILVLGGTDCNHFKRETLIDMLQALSQLGAVCLYSGSDDTKGIQQLASLGNCTWVKVGSYKEKLGGLQSKTTNQRFYKAELRMKLDYKERNYSVEPIWKDVTELFWR